MLNNFVYFTATKTECVFHALFESKTGVPTGGIDVAICDINIIFRGDFQAIFGVFGGESMKV